MASNFSILFLREKGSLSMKLKGDFDGSSALVLFDALKRNCNDRERILVDTDGIKRVYPFGRELFQSNLPGLKRSSAKISFIGKNRNNLAPGGPL